MSETQRKFLGKGGLIALTLVIVILVVSNVWTFVSLQTQVIALEGDKNTLEDEKNTLLNYKETHSHNDSEYSNLNSEYVSAVQSYQALQDSYQTLQSDYNSLSLVYDDLQRNYEIENILRIGNSLESYYDYVRINVKPQSDLQYVNLAVNLAVHSLGENSFPTIENEFFTTVGKHSYDIAKEKLDEVANFIGLQSNETSVNNIKKILQFINQHIHYEYEIGSPYLAPIETMGFKSGDCEDFTILASALFKKIGIDSAFGRFKNDKNEYHAMVLVHLENLGSYGYWYYSDLTYYGLASGKWIIIEPQYTIENQNTDWIKQWTIVAAASLN